MVLSLRSGERLAQKQRSLALLRPVATQGSQVACSAFAYAYRRGAGIIPDGGKIGPLTLQGRPEQGQRLPQSGGPFNKAPETATSSARPSGSAE